MRHIRWKVIIAASNWPHSRKKNLDQRSFLPKLFKFAKTFFRFAVMESGCLASRSLFLSTTHIITVFSTVTFWCTYHDGLRTEIFSNYSCQEFKNNLELRSEKASCYVILKVKRLKSSWTESKLKNTTCRLRTTALDPKTRELCYNSNEKRNKEVYEYSQAQSTSKKSLYAKIVSNFEVNINILRRLSSEARKKGTVHIMRMYSKLQQ